MTAKEIEVTATMDQHRASRLLRAIRDLSLSRDLDAVMAVVRTAARELTSADGATFILRDGDHCFYADEDAISPLWKGKRFPMSSCLSGWVMEHREGVVIDDIVNDPRIPQDAYSPTFVKSVAMVPIRAERPVGAIGNYWARRHRATAEQVQLLQALADSTAITLENVQLYRQLERRAAEAEGAVRTRDDFLSIAAHELRTPLTTLQLQLDLLARDASGVDALQRGRLERARGSGRRLAELIDMMLTASQAASSALELDRRPCDLVDMARKVLEQSAVEAERAGCPLELDAPDALDGTWDGTRLTLVVNALVSNAIHHGHRRPIRVRIEAGPPARLTVTNEGGAIPEAQLAVLFQRFSRASTERRQAGLGLGLYVAREIVLAHGGTLSAESRPDEGTTFTLELPYQPPSTALRTGAPLAR